MGSDGAATGKQAAKQGRMAALYRQASGRRNNAIKFFVIFVDLALVILSYVIAFYARFGGSPPEYNTSPFVSALPLIAFFFLAYTDIFGLLKFYRKSRNQIMSSIMKLVFMQALTTTSITFFLREFSFPRSVLLIAAIVQAVLLTAWNWLMLGLRDRYSDAT